MSWENIECVLWNELNERASERKWGEEEREYFGAIEENCFCQWSSVRLCGNGWLHNKWHFWPVPRVHLLELKFDWQKSSFFSFQLMSLRLVKLDFQHHVWRSYDQQTARATARLKLPVTHTPMLKTQTMKSYVTVKLWSKLIFNERNEQNYFRLLAMRRKI